MTESPQSLEIEVWSVDRLIFYARNPRKNDAAVDRMCSSIREFGFKIPVLARSDGEVVDGHLRLKAARKLEITEVPVILCDEWTPAQVKAFRLMVNRSVTWAGWDVAIWNSLPGVEPIKGFKSAKAAASRIWERIQRVNVVIIVLLGATLCAVMTSITPERLKGKAIVQ